MENTEKKRIRFNIIDLVIILAVIGCFCGIALRYNVMDKIGLNNARDKVEIEFRIIGIRPTSYDAMVKGDTFYWQQNGMRIGTLKEAVSEYSKTYVIRDDQQIVCYEREDRYDVVGTITAEGILSEDGFMLNGTQQIAPGKEMKVESKNIAVTLTVTKIKPVD